MWTFNYAINMPLYLNSSICHCFLGFRLWKKYKDLGYLLCYICLLHGHGLLSPRYYPDINSRDDIPDGGIGYSRSWMGEPSCENIARVESCSEITIFNSLGRDSYYCICLCQPSRYHMWFSIHWIPISLGFMDSIWQMLCQTLTEVGIADIFCCNLWICLWRRTKPKMLSVVKKCQILCMVVSMDHDHLLLVINLTRLTKLWVAKPAGWHIPQAGRTSFPPHPRTSLPPSLHACDQSVPS